MKDTKNMEVTVKMSISDSDASNNPDEEACFVDSTKAAADRVGDEFWKMMQPLKYQDAVTLIGKIYDLSNSEAPVRTLTHWTPRVPTSTESTRRTRPTIMTVT